MIARILLHTSYFMLLVYLSLRVVHRVAVMLAFKSQAIEVQKSNRQSLFIESPFA